MLPKGYYPEDVEEEVKVPPRRKVAQRPVWHRALPIGVAAVAMLGFSGLLLVTYFSSGSGVAGPPPLIRADQRPYKVRPENPGGMDVPHQDTGIMNQPRGVAPVRAGAPEHLLPPPESPLPRPVAAPPVLQPEIPAPPVIAPPPDAVEVQVGRRPPPPAAPGPIAIQAPAAAPAAAPPPQPQPPSSQVTLRPPNTGRDQAVALVPPGQVSPAARPPGTQGAVVPPTLGFRIQLGVMRSAAEAEREWQRLLANNNDLIGRLSPIFPGRGNSYRIQAGPLLTQDGAAQLCRRLHGRGVGCVVVKP